MKRRGHTEEEKKRRRLHYHVKRREARKKLKPQVVRSLATVFQSTSPGDSAIGSSSLVELDASASTVSDSTNKDQADTYCKPMLEPPIKDDGLPINPI